MKHDQKGRVMMWLSVMSAGVAFIAWFLRKTAVHGPVNTEEEDSALWI